MGYMTGDYSEEFLRAWKFYNSDNLDKKDIAYKLWCARAESRWKKKDDK